VIPADYFNFDDMYTATSTDINTIDSYSSNLLNFGLSSLNAFSNFMQIPITFEGINKTIDSAMGPFNEIHVAWASNRNKYWDIYYSNNFNKTIPYRYDTKITDTKSVSMNPSMDVGDNGYRLITWQDNRDGLFQIYAAKTVGSLKNSYNSYESYNSYDVNKVYKDFFITVLSNVSDPYVESIQNNEKISFEFSKDYCDTSVGDGANYFGFILQFYSDIDMTDENLITTVNSNIDNSSWIYDGIDFGDNGAIVFDGQTVTIEYNTTYNSVLKNTMFYVSISAILNG